MKRLLLLLFLLTVSLFLCSCFYQPQISLSGTKLDFETVDINGDPVSSESLFAEHEVTMLNLWASWCGPCINELSELERVSRELEGTGCAVIGLINEEKSPQNLKTAGLYLEENGVTYRNLLRPDNMNELIAQRYFPTTVFVDKNGVIIGKTLFGTVAEKYVFDYYMNAVNETLELMQQE